MGFKLYMLAIMLAPLLGFSSLSWLVIYPIKRFFPDTQARHDAIMVAHSAVLIGVFALMVQMVYGLHLLEKAGY